MFLSAIYAIAALSAAQPARGPSKLKEGSLRVKTNLFASSKVHGVTAAIFAMKHGIVVQK